MSASLAHARIAKLVHEHGVGWVETQLGVSEGTVRKWLKDGNRPQMRMRARVYEVFTIAQGDWEKRPPPFQARRLPVRLAHSVTTNGAPKTDLPIQDETQKLEVGDDVRANLTHVLAKLRRALDTAEGRGIPPIAQAISNCCRLLARISGELEVTEAQILRSAQWNRIVKMVRDVLAKYPGASEELDKVLADYESGG